MMQLHLDEIARNVAKGAHAVLLLDRAGWHTTSKLDVPANITPIFLPSRAPELNPVENVWQYLRQNWLSNTRTRTPSSTRPATHGANSPPIPNGSNPSACAIGPTSVSRNGPWYNIVANKGSATQGVAREDDIPCNAMPTYRAHSINSVPIE
jgi:hypothetical protein